MLDIDTRFYSIWRNCYIRGIIRNIVCQNSLIKVDSVEDLLDNYKYLSLFTEQDKIDNSIYIRLNIKNRKEFNQYKNNEYRFIVNDLMLDDVDEQKDIIGMPFNDIHKGVLRITCWLDDKSDGGGVLPDTLTEFIVHTRNRRFINSRLDQVLSALPGSVRRLELPRHYQISTVLEIPDTLVDLDYFVVGSNVKKMVVPPNKLYNNCYASIDTMEELEWVRDHPFIVQLVVGWEDEDAPDTLTRGMFPSNIRYLDIGHDGAVEQDALPHSLETLNYRSTIPHTIPWMPRYLTSLLLDNLSEQLDKDMLPTTLTTLSIYNYDHPLLPGVLPNRLIRLQLTTFNHQLDLGSLPQSLTDLTLASFNHELQPHVLPSNLLSLDLSEYTQSFPAADTLPSTLTKLELNGFTQSFTFVEPMNDLSHLYVRRLDSSTARIITNVKDIRITCGSIDPDIDLQNTSILHLQLLMFGARIPLSANLVPRQIKSLRLFRIDIESNDLIPNTCEKLETDDENQDLDLSLIPSSTKHSFYEY